MVSPTHFGHSGVVFGFHVFSAPNFSLACGAVVSDSADQDGYIGLSIETPIIIGFIWLYGFDWTNPKN